MNIQVSQKKIHLENFKLHNSQSKSVGVTIPGREYFPPLQDIGLESVVVKPEKRMI